MCDDVTGWKRRRTPQCWRMTLTVWCNKQSVVATMWCSYYTLNWIVPECMQARTFTIVFAWVTLHRSAEYIYQWCLIAALMTHSFCTLQRRTHDIHTHSHDGARIRRGNDQTAWSLNNISATFIRILFGYRKQHRSGLKWPEFHSQNNSSLLYSEV